MKPLDNQEKEQALEQLLDLLKEAGRLLDKQPVPLTDRLWWNPETNEVEPV